MVTCLGETLEPAEEKQQLKAEYTQLGWDVWRGRNGLLLEVKGYKVLM